jgi:hypothetical protein
MQVLVFSFSTFHPGWYEISLSAGQNLEPPAADRT